MHQTQTKQFTGAAGPRQTGRPSATTAGTRAPALCAY